LWLNGGEGNRLFDFAAVGWQDMAAETPISNGLVVDIGLRFGQEGLETVGDSQLFGAGAGVVGTAAAPQVEQMAGVVQAADVGDYGGHGDTSLANAADEGVVNIDEYGFGAGRIHVRLPEKKTGLKRCISYGYIAAGYGRRASA